MTFQYKGIITPEVMEIKKIRLYKCRVYLFCLYILCKKSTYEIGEMCRVGYNTINNWLRKFNIRIRPKSEANKIAQNRPEVRIKINEIWNNPDYREMHSGENSRLYGKYGKEHPNWKENYKEISYFTKHRRMHITLVEMGILEPDYCPYCNKPKSKKRKLDLINLFHIYLENPLDYYFMCQKCHNIYHSLAGLGGKTSGITIKPIPNLIKNLKQLQTREEREKLLKEVILKSLIKEHDEKEE